MVGTGAQDDFAFALEEGVRQGTHLCKVSGAKLGAVQHNMRSAGHAARGWWWWYWAGPYVTPMVLPPDTTTRVTCAPHKMVKLVRAIGA